MALSKPLRPEARPISYKPRQPEVRQSRRPEATKDHGSSALLGHRRFAMPNHADFRLVNRPSSATCKLCNMTAAMEGVEIILVYGVFY